MIDQSNWKADRALYEGNISKGRLMFFVAIIILTYVWLPTDLDLLGNWERFLDQPLEMAGSFVLLFQSGLFALMWWKGSQFARKLLFAATLLFSVVLMFGACAIFYAYMTSGLSRQSAVVSESLLRQVVFVSTTACLSLIGAGILLLKQVVAFVSFRSKVRHERVA